MISLYDEHDNERILEVALTVVYEAWKPSVVTLWSLANMTVITLFVDVIDGGPLDPQYLPPTTV